MQEVVAAQENPSYVRGSATSVAWDDDVQLVVSFEIDGEIHTYRSKSAEKPWELWLES